MVLVEKGLSKQLLVPPVAGLILEACRSLALPFSTVILVEVFLSNNLLVPPVAGLILEACRSLAFPLSTAPCQDHPATSWEGQQVCQDRQNNAMLGPMFSGQQAVWALFWAAGVSPPLTRELAWPNPTQTWSDVLIQRPLQHVACPHHPTRVP